MMEITTDMTFEQVRIAQDEFVDAGGNAMDPSAPVFKFVALQGLKELEAAFEGGEKFALMHAIRECANHGLLMPQWVADGYIQAFDTVNHYRSKSWDGVFGKPHPKNANIAALRKRDLNAVHVWNAVLDSEKKGLSINDELFESIGKKLGLGLTLTKEYYAYFSMRSKEFK